MSTPDMKGCDVPSALRDTPGLPRTSEGDPVFAEPWQASAFALTVHLFDRGLFTWSEWADALSAEVKRPGRDINGADYYDCWVDALSGLVEAKGITDAGTILGLQQSWQRAAEATPHGKPIVLENDPFAHVLVTPPRNPSPQGGGANSRPDGAPCQRFDLPKR